jgi:hypothetical protein
MDTIKSKTQRYYFNAEFINNTGQLQDARYDAQLIYPLLDHPNEYDICINRTRIDLAGIPLNLGGVNIPFQEWEVSLGYYDGTNWNYKNSFVPQFNPKTSSGYNYYSLNNNNSVETAYPLNPYTITSTSTLDNSDYTRVLPTFDNAYNTITFYTLSADEASIKVYQNNNATPIATIPQPTDAYFYEIQHLFTDATGNLYIAYLNSVPPIGDTYTPLILQYTRTSINTWAIGAIYDYPTVAFSDIYIQTGFTLFNEIEQIVLYYGQASLTTASYLIFNVGPPLTIIPGTTTTNRFVSITNADYVYRCDNAGNFSVATNNAYILQTTGIYVRQFLGFDSDNNLLVSSNDSLGNFTGYNALNNLSGAVVYSFTPPNGSFAIGVGQPFDIIVDSGKTDNIYTYQKYLNQINRAFESAYEQMVATYGALYTPTQAPKVIYNADSKLFQMIVEGVYLQNSKFLIDFNYNLNQLFLFNNYADSNNAGFYLLEVLNNYTNAIVGNGAITTPQFLYVEQQTSTTYQFWNLARIIIATSKMGVNGDSEGFSGNNQILAITDFTPDTTTLSPNSIVIYSPFVLRFYQMYQTSPLTRLDLSLLIGDKAGNVYPLQLQGNGGYASVKLEWRKSENN